MRCTSLHTMAPYLDTVYNRHPSLGPQAGPWPWITAARKYGCAVL